MIGSDIGAGAGAGADTDDDSNAGSMLTPMFTVVPNEQVGQLYAYRINDSAVVLGTRRASTFGVSIGIGSVANGAYQCLAENDNARSQNIITISVKSKFIASYVILLYY